MTPLVTVLLAVHNGEAFLEPALRSVLAQTFEDFELLVIDDASTDRTSEMLRACSDPRLRVERNERNVGLTVSLNRGLQLARGEFIARHDADDLPHARRLELQTVFLKSHPGVAAVGAQARLIDGRGRSLGLKDFPHGHRGICWMHLFDNALAHSAVMFRKRAVIDAGGYDERFRASQDYELWSRMSERHALANLPERLVTLRIVEDSITRTHRQPELIREVQRAHWRRLFPGREPLEDELELIGQFRSRVEPARLAEFYALFDELLEWYRAAWPETKITADFCRTLALQYERIGYNLLPVARGLGLRELARAARTWPPRLLSLPWLRIAALALLGDGARDMHERARQVFGKATGRRPVSR